MGSISPLCSDRSLSGSGNDYATGIGGPPGTVERAGELGQDGEVGVKPNPIQPKRDDFLRDLAKVAQKPEPAKRDGKQP